MMYAETGNYPAEVAVKRDSHVAQQLNDMDAALEELSKQVEGLSAQLRSVIREDSEGVDKAMAAVDEPIVPLADRCREHVRFVQRMSSKLYDLSRRIEL